MIVNGVTKEMVLRIMVNIDLTKVGKFIKRF